MQYSRHILGIFLCITLASCSEPEVPELPKDPQVVHGTLVPAELSRTRRGTHILRKKHEDVYFVESKTTSLHPFEYMPVTASGILQHNIDPSTQLPVLVVSNVEIREEKLQEWNIDSMHLSLVAPVEWTGSENDQALQLFTNKRMPIVSITNEETTEPFSLFIRQLSYDRSFSIDGHQSIEAYNNETGQRAVYIDRDTHIVTILFAPQSLQYALQWQDNFLGLLRSIRLADIPDKTPDTPTSVTPTTPSVPDWIGANETVSTGPVQSALGRPCGGSAGILCPGGYYCAITDFADSIGTCQLLE